MTVPKAEIRVAAAIIRDQQGRMLLVRKAGTQCFMQPGGKMEADEAPRDALAREIHEELGVNMITADRVGTFTALAANEPGHTVIAEVFSVNVDDSPDPAAEIAEMIWFYPDQHRDLQIAPLSRQLLDMQPQ